ncbi:MAG: hypothetical protein U0136_06650 [Bdellovibrionota bacterium]
MNVVPMYGRFGLRDISVTSLSFRMSGAFARFRDVVRRCGHRSWFPEIAEGVPPPDRTEWWTGFQRSLTEIERQAVERTSLVPSAQLRLYYASIQEAFETHLGMENTWQLAISVSPEQSSIGFAGVIEQPFSDSTSAYCELALELHVNSRGSARLKYIAPTWIGAHPLALRCASWPGGHGFRDLTWQLPDGTRGSLESLLGTGKRASPQHRPAKVRLGQRDRMCG